MLEEIDPARAAAGQKREILAGFQPVDQLGALFHDGQVSREVGVKHLGKTETTQSRDHFAGGDGASRKVEFFAQGNADGRRGLNHDVLARVIDGAPDFVFVADFSQRADRASHDALAAERAAGLNQRLEILGRHGGIKAAVDAGQHADRLHDVARRLATAAHDALGRVTADCAAADVNRELVLLALVFDFMHVKLMRQALQFAVLVHGANQAILRVIGQKQAEHGTAGADCALGIRLYHHAFGHWRAAGRSQGRPFLDLDHANPAGAGFVLNAHAVQFGVTQRRNLQPQGTRCFQNRRAFRNGHWDVIYFQVDHRLVAPMLNLLLVNGLELTLLEADAAFDALVLINHMALLGHAGNRIFRAVLGADAAADAFLIDGEADQPGASARRAAALIDMGLIFIHEVGHGGEDRVGRGLPKAAQGGVLDDEGEAAQLNQGLGVPLLRQMLVSIRTGDGCRFGRACICRTIRRR